MNYNTAIIKIMNFHLLKHIFPPPEFNEVTYLKKEVTSSSEGVPIIKMIERPR
jgi:hypothetical protein